MVEQPLAPLRGSGQEPELNPLMLISSGERWEVVSDSFP